MRTKIVKTATIIDLDGGAQLELRRRIEQRAYDLWVEGGRPDGLALSHWLQAERELSAQAAPSATRESPRANGATKAKINTKPSANSLLEQGPAI